MTAPPSDLRPRVAPSPPSGATPPPLPGVAPELSGLHPKPAPDRDWQLHLVELLAKLEHYRQQLVGCRLSADADYVLDQCEAAVQQTEDVAKRVQFPDATAAAQMEAMAKGGAVFGAANDARRPGGRSLFKSMLTAFAADDGSQAPAVRVVLDMTQDALSSYFSLFTGRYPSSLSARGWVDAASSYLADLKQTAKELEG